MSLLFNIKPEKVKYDHSLMRLHLLKMFNTNIIEHFPQDSSRYFSKSSSVSSSESLMQLGNMQQNTLAKLRKKQKKNEINKIFDICQLKRETKINQINILIQSIRVTVDNVTEEVKYFM